MTKEARIILPTHDNDGNCLKGLHREFRLRLVREFGGFTAARAEGGWYDETAMVLHEEDVITYDIAINEDGDDMITLFNIADEYCGKARQVCVYVRGLPGLVHFVEHTPVEAIVAT